MENAPRCASYVGGALIIIYPDEKNLLSRENTRSRRQRGGTRSADGEIRASRVRGRMTAAVSGVIQRRRLK